MWDYAGGKFWSRRRNKFFTGVSPHIYTTNNTTLSTLSTSIDDQFKTAITYVDDKITEQQEYTDQEIEALTWRTEGYIQEALI